MIPNAICVLFHGWGASAINGEYTIICEPVDILNQLRIPKPFDALRRFAIIKVDNLFTEVALTQAGELA
jgi:hypothetical protein